MPTKCQPHRPQLPAQAGRGVGVPCAVLLLKLRGLEGSPRLQETLSKRPEKTQLEGLPGHRSGRGLQCDDICSFQPDLEDLLLARGYVLPEHKPAVPGRTLSPRRNLFPFLAVLFHSLIPILGAFSSDAIMLGPYAVLQVTFVGGWGGEMNGFAIKFLESVC